MTKPDWELAWEKDYPANAARHARDQLSEPRQWERAGFKYGYLAALNVTVKAVVVPDEQLRLEAFLVATGRTDPPEPGWPSAKWVKTGLGDYPLWSRIAEALAKRQAKAKVEDG